MAIPEPGRDFYSYILAPQVVGIIKRSGGLWCWHLETRTRRPLGPKGVRKSMAAAYAEMLRAYDKQPKKPPKPPPFIPTEPEGWRRSAAGRGSRMTREAAGMLGMLRPGPGRSGYLWYVRDAETRALVDCGTAKTLEAAARAADKVMR